MEGEAIVLHRTLPLAITELKGMKSFDKLIKKDIVFSSSKTKDLETVVRTLLEKTSWVDWWTYAAKSLAFRNKSDVAKVKHLFMAGTRCQLLVAKTASTVRASMLLSWLRWRIILVLSPWSFAIFPSPTPMICSHGCVSERAAKKSSHVLHDGAIQKAFFLDKPQKRLTKHLHFT